MNCCLQFLFLNFLAGCFIFIVLGIFVITDNPFLKLINIKEKDGKKEYGETEKKNAYIQYFSAAGFNFFFAFTIWFITNMRELFVNEKKEIKQFKKEMQVINEFDNDIKKNTAGMEIIKENDNNNIINTNTNEIQAINTITTDKTLGMTEKAI